MNIEQQQQKNASLPKYFSLPHSLTFSDLPRLPACLSARVLCAVCAQNKMSENTLDSIRKPNGKMWKDGREKSEFKSNTFSSPLCQSVSAQQTHKWKQCAWVYNAESVEQLVESDRMSEHRKGSVDRSNRIHATVVHIIPAHSHTHKHYIEIYWNGKNVLCVLFN